MLPRFRTLTGTLVAAALIGGSVVTGSQVAAAQSVLSYPTTSVDVTIPVRDGVTLNASVSRPVAGTWPVVIMPGTFAGDAITLVEIAKKLSSRGFVTVTFNERGFGKSTGQLDAGGLLDAHDASDALTWAQKNLPVRPGPAGITGISYGAGIAPIAAATDPRFTAVAMVSGWGDMWESRFPNDTPAWASNVALNTIANVQGRPGPEVQKFFDEAIAGQQTATGRQWAAVRSPKNYLTGLKANHPALYMSTTMNEMIWPVDQTLPFFDAYTGKKHLDLLPGDHASTNGPQFLGWTDVAWDTAFDWLDTELTGDPKARSLPQVRVSVRGPDEYNLIESGLWSKYPFESFGSLAAATGSTTVRQYLNSKPGLLGTVSTSLSSSAGTGSKSLRQGTNVLLNNGIPMLQGILEDTFGWPTIVPVDGVDQGVTGLWYSGAQPAKLRIRGAARAHLEITPTAADGSVFLYLLDRAPNNGDTYVISHKPYTFHGATPGKPLSLDIALPYNSFDVPAGHKVVLGVSTGDVMYTSANRPGSTIAVGPGSYLDLPVS